MLRNLLTVLERNAPGLKHVTLYQGGKAYGADLRPFKTPAREDDPRLMGPNFYYDQEDFLRSLQTGKGWNFSILRPEAVCGYAVGNPMNLAMVIAVYAAISKELGLPLRFPGPEAAYRALYQVTSADILARAADWAGETAGAANEIFNITNGDYFRWQFMWPRIADAFGMEVAEPVPMPLKIYMADKAPLWAKMVEKYGLKPIPYDHLVNWAFGDFISIPRSTTSPAPSKRGRTASVTASIPRRCSQTYSPACGSAVSSRAWFSRNSFQANSKLVVSRRTVPQRLAAVTRVKTAH